MTFRPECPRCGYDQSGLVDSWKDSCPLTGICTECGHTLDWRIVMRPELVRLPGLYEHARRFWSGSSALRTWSWAVRPPVFARKVRLEHAPNIVRLLLWLPVLTLPLHVLVAVSRSLTWMFYAQSLRGGGRAPPVWDWPRFLNFWTTPVGHFQSGPWGPRTWSDCWFMFFRSAPVFPWVGLTVMLAVPATLLLLTTTRARSKVRAGHLLRCTVYGLAWVPLVFLVTAASAAHTAWLSWGVARAGSISWQTSPIPGAVLGNLAGVWLAGVVLWSMLWWWYAVVHVLKLHQARLVWLLMMAVALLVGFMTYLFVDDRAIWRWLL